MPKPTDSISRELLKGTWLELVTLTREQRAVVIVTDPHSDHGKKAVKPDSTRVTLESSHLRITRSPLEDCTTNTELKRLRREPVKVIPQHNQICEKSCGPWFLVPSLFGIICATIVLPRLTERLLVASPILIALTTRPCSSHRSMAA